MAATSVLAIIPATISHNNITKMPLYHFSCSSASTFTFTRRSNSSFNLRRGGCLVSACLPQQPSTPPPPPPPRPKTRLYVSGLSFRTTEEGLRNTFQDFGQLVDGENSEFNLVMDKIANRPRGFAFLRYATEEESQKAIEGMHGKFLDGRVIFVEFAKPRAELRQGLQRNPRQI
ncbi:hypothetical protein Dsin_004518 [Dipteronia sinensis]|uniref:RRM domain-containing protein n=1 Tax=Dipteronia sinensis TaxID=43782 RepID=A0AAE0AUR0_9ROSI|nr:hypothetical protein Dsin_004518 [Dipteronia sinensis]